MDINKLYNVAMIDIKRQVKINVQLQDQDGDEISVQETTEMICDWLSDKLKDDAENSAVSQVIPLITQVMVTGIVKILGEDLAAYMLATDINRQTLLRMTALGFYLYKLMQAEGLKIHTQEEPVSQEDIDSHQRTTNASDIITQAKAQGINTREIIAYLLKEGYLTASDLERYGIEIPEDIDQNEELDKKDMN